MSDSAYPLLVSLLTHTQRLLQPHAKLLAQAARRGGPSAAELAEHEQMLVEVKAVVEAQQRWLRHIDAPGDRTRNGSD
jgi:hypothetical protein